MGIIDVSSPLPGSSVQADGFMELSQIALMTDKLSYYNSEPIFDYSYFQTGDASALSWPRIISNYLSRSCNPYGTYLVQPKYAAHTIWNFPPSNTAPFTISLKVRIPTWDVAYRPGLLEVLKAGWIQYISVFIFTGGILWATWDYLVTHQIIRTIAYSQAKPGAKVLY
jgi:hypothetical protein